MKLRMIPLALTLCMLLTACGLSWPITEDSAAPVPSGADSAVPAPAESGADGNETDSVPNKPENPVSLPMSSSVTPGGFRVQTDASKYSSYTPPEERYTRPKDADLTTFHPQQGLGLVFPYVAAKLYTSSEDGYSWEEGYRYGFVDRTGRLLTDGIYTDVDPLTYYSDTLEGPSYLPLWRTERVGDVTVHHEHSEYGDYSYPEGDILYGIVAMDGSFTLPCEYRRIDAMEGRFVCARDWSELDFEVYNLQGELLLHDSDLFRDYKDCDSWYVEYSEGLYALSAYYDTGESTFAKKENAFWFADETGKPVLGPYRSGSAFHDGLACVSADGTWYGYIDHSGRWVLPAEYTWNVNFNNGRAQQVMGDDRRVLIDKNGQELITCYGAYLYDAPCGIAVNDYYADTDHYSFFDLDGNLLLAEDGRWSCLAKDLFAHYTNGNTVLHSLNPAQEDITLENVTDLYSSAAWIDEHLLLGYRGESTDGEKKIFVPEDLSQVYEMDDSNPVDIYGDAFSYFAQDQMTGESFWIILDHGLWRVIDRSGTLRCEVRGERPSILGNRLFDIGDLAFTYTSFDGQLLFSYPLMAED